MCQVFGMMNWLLDDYSDVQLNISAEIKWSNGILGNVRRAADGTAR